MIKPRQQKTYTIIAPSGETVQVLGIARFAEENGLDYWTLKDFLTRKGRSRNWYEHKGWSKPGLVKPSKDLHPWRIEAKNRIEYMQKLKAVAGKSMEVPGWGVFNQE